MRTGRSVFEESIAVFRYRRVFRRMRRVAGCALPTILAGVAAANIVTMEPFDGLLAMVDMLTIVWMTALFVWELTGD